ncbi:MAG: hypothetical protein ACTSRA_05495 [Promethearchaeota archaeon]
MKSNAYQVLVPAWFTSAVKNLRSKNYPNEGCALLFGEHITGGLSDSFKVMRLREMKNI